jgi:hypothetical protein
MKKTLFSKIEYNSNLVNKKFEEEYVSKYFERTENPDATVFAFNKKQLTELLFEYKLEVVNGKPILFAIDDIFKLYVDLHQYLDILRFEQIKYKKMLDEKKINYEIHENEIKFSSKFGYQKSYILESILVDYNDIKDIEIKSKSIELEKFKKNIGLIQVF